jgi:hypothetical protein
MAEAIFGLSDVRWWLFGRHKTVSAALVVPFGRDA